MYVMEYYKVKNFAGDWMDLEHTVGSRESPELVKSQENMYVAMSTAMSRTPEPQTHEWMSESYHQD